MVSRNEPAKGLFSGLDTTRLNEEYPKRKVCSSHKPDSVIVNVAYLASF